MPQDDFLSSVIRLAQHSIDPRQEGSGLTPLGVKPGVKGGVLPPQRVQITILPSRLDATLKGWVLRLFFWAFHFLVPLPSQNSIDHHLSSPLEFSLFLLAFYGARARRSSWIDLPGLSNLLSRCCMLSHASRNFALFVLAAVGSRVLGVSSGVETFAPCAV